MADELDARTGHQLEHGEVSGDLVVATERRMGAMFVAGVRIMMIAKNPEGFWLPVVSFKKSNCR